MRKNIFVLDKHKYLFEYFDCLKILLNENKDFNDSADFNRHEESLFVCLFVFCIVQRAGGNCIALAAHDRFGLLESAACILYLLMGMGIHSPSLQCKLAVYLYILYTCRSVAVCAIFLANK